MATTISRQALFLTLFTLASTLPNNYYHQEYKYKTSSSSYRNNELQHQNEDEGFMSKQGDLEGRTVPLVNSHSQHSEYINPKLRDSRYISPNDRYNSDTSEGYMDVDHTVGNMGAQFMNNYGTGSRYGSNGYSGNLASGSLTSGNLARNSYSSSYGSSASYGTSYSMPSSLRSITQQLQDDYARQLQHSQYGYNRDFNQLEEELRQNVSRRLQDALQTRYGTQSIRSGLSYTINNGHTLPTANYDHQELMDLQRQMENDLLSQLRRQYYSQSSSSSSYQSNSNYQHYTTSSTTMRPYTSYSTHIPVYVPSYTSTTTTRIPIYSAPYSSYSSSSATQRGESITNIATRVQSDLDNRLNTILDNLQRNRQYEDYNTLSDRLQNELRSNITYFLDREIQRTYGNQVLRDGYMYNTGSYNNQYNYSVRDLENLKQQIESNLIQKLNRDLQRYRTNQSSASYTQNRFSDYGTSGNYVNRGDSAYYGSTEAAHTNRPTAPNLLPLITGTKSHNSYNYQASYGTSGISAGTISQIQSQLQNDLSRQLQAAINRNRYGYSSYNNGPRNYQVSFQELSDELNRNLTRQLSEYQSRYASGSGYSGSTAQFDDLRNQVQENLMRELQQGLQHSYSSSSSYTASSSSSNYRPARANIATYQTGEDCEGQLGHAVYKRSPYRHSGYRSYQQQIEDNNLLQQQERQHFERVQQEEDLGLTQQQEPSGFGRLPSAELTQQQEDVGFGRLQFGGQQQLDDFDLTQQQEPQDFGRIRSPYAPQSADLTQGYRRPPKVPKNEDLTQQQENDDSGTFQVSGQQQLEDSDLTQQQEQQDFGKIRSLNVPQSADLTQQPDQLAVGYRRPPKVPRNEDFTQQQEKDDTETFQVGGQQQLDDSDLTQQQEQEDFGKVRLPNRPQSGDLTQQQESISFGNIQPPKPPKVADLTQQQENDSSERFQVGEQQQLDDFHLTQQQEQDNFGKLHNPYAPQSADLTQQPDQRPFGYRKPPSAPKNTDLGQQRENDNYEQLQVGGQQQIDDSDLTQQQEQEVFGKIRLPYAPQSGDLTQQQEDITFGNRQPPKAPKIIDLSQQTEKNNYEQLQVVGQQQLEDSDLTQQEEHDFGHGLTPKSQPNGKIDFETVTVVDLQQELEPLAQQLDQKPADQHLTQQQELSYGKLENVPNKIEGEGLVQQEEVTGFGKFQIGNQQTEKPWNKPQQATEQIEDLHLTQQQEETDFKQFQKQTDGQHEDIVDQFLSQVPVAANQNKLENEDLTQKPKLEQFQTLNQEQTQIGKLDTNTHLSQQQEDDFRGPQSGHLNKYTGQSELTQQEEDIGFGKFQFGNQQEQVNQNQIDDINLTQQQEENVKFPTVTTIKNVEETDGLTVISSSTSRIDREFLEKINRENDMLIEMVRQRAIERQRQSIRQQDIYQSHRYQPYSPYQPRTYDSAYSGRSYAAASPVNQAYPQEVGTPYHHHQVGYQKPLEVESSQEVEVIKPIQSDPNNPTIVKSESVDANIIDENAVTPEEGPTPKPGFWKRLGNKISTGAKAIKEKIVG